MNKTLPSFIWYFLNHHKLCTFTLIGLAIIGSVDLVIRSYILKIIIDIVTEGPLNQDLTAALYTPFTYYIIMLIIINIIMRGKDYVSLKMFPLIKANIITQVTTYLESHSFTYFQNNFVGSLVNKICDLDNNIEQIIKIIINGFLVRTVALVISLITVAHINILFTNVIFVWSLVFFIINIIATKYAKNLSKIFAESRSNLIGKIADSIANITSILFFVRNYYEISIISKQLQDVISKDQEAQKFRLFVYFFQGVSVIGLTCILIYLLVHLRQHNLITVGDFAFVMTVSFSIADSVCGLSNDYVYFSMYIGISNQALSIITQKHSVIDKPNAQSLKLNEGRIEFKNVTFGYTQNNNLFLNQSVTIYGKQKVGLVGYSGSGKTTFINLICRLFDLESGEILIDDQNISDVTQASIRENIGFISQDLTLFHRSLMENIRYGKLDATDLEVMEAAKKAYAHEFIINIPEGYNALVGERGIKLSGGQKQRIAIARAIIKNAPILILDEATSSLDSMTERLIQESLTTLMKNKTVLVIAHRLSTLLSMERILVFNKGHIVEDGTHEELLAAGKVYATLWNGSDTVTKAP